MEIKINHELRRNQSPIQCNLKFTILPNKTSKSTDHGSIFDHCNNPFDKSLQSKLQY